MRPLPKLKTKKMVTAIRVWIQENPVRQRRQQLNWTMSQLCCRAGIIYSTLEGVERGKTREIMGTVGKLAKVLGVSPGKLAQEMWDWWDAKPTDETATVYLWEQMSKDE